MENQNNKNPHLQKHLDNKSLQTQSTKSTRELKKFNPNNLLVSIAKVEQRTQLKAINIPELMIDIDDQFNKADEEDVMRAMKAGALGEYGVTFRLSSQVICFWIRSYLTEKNPNWNKTAGGGSQYGKI